ncbi:MAG: CapA family protein [Sandaracinaceae bacterium]
MRSASIGVIALLLGTGCAEPASAAPEVVAPAPPVVAAPPPVPAPPPASPPTPRVTIAAAGDLVLNPHAMRAVLDDGDDGYGHLLAGYAAVLREDDLAFLNLEQPLVDDLVPLDAGWPRQDTSRPRRSPILGATPPLADALAAAGVDVVAVANNHAYDQGYRGLARTLDELARAQVDAVGAGPDTDAAHAPVVIERAGLRVAFVAFSEFFNQHPTGEAEAVAARVEDERVAASIAAARQDADLVVVSIHWSRDFLERAAIGEERHARRLVEAGADVVLGTGPHVLHRVERLESPRGEAVAAYSLGNVASGMGRTYVVGHPPHGFIHPANVTPEARDGVVLRITAQVEDGRVRIAPLEAVPLWTENNWLATRRTEVAHRVRVVRLAEADEALREERRPRIQRALGDAVTLVDR